LVAALFLSTAHVHMARADVFHYTPTVLFGSLSDRIGRRLNLFLSAGLLLASVWPLLLWLRADPSFANLLIVQSILCVLVASFVGVAPAALSGDLSDLGSLDRHLLGV
jgi:MFS family permease